MSHDLYPASHEKILEPDLLEFYRNTMTVLQDARVPFMVGGAYALAAYTGIVRHTKDFDIFLNPGDADRALRQLAQKGYRTELTFPHWLGKAFHGRGFVDLIYSSGNGVAEVDHEWFENAVPVDLLGLAVQVIPVEEMIWSKGFVMERERYDGADIIHLLRAQADGLDWRRLLRRYGPYWRVLLSHLVLFGFAYPGERNRVPGWVMEDLLRRLQNEMVRPPSQGHICQGSLISREQFLIDIDEWGYQDARLQPRGSMSEEDVDHWTAAIDKHD
jgi:hypothetical protein